MDKLQFKYFNIVGIIAVTISFLVTLLSLYLLSAHIFYKPSPLLVVGEVLSDTLFSVLFIGYFISLKVNKSIKNLTLCSFLLSIFSIFMCMHTRTIFFVHLEEFAGPVLLFIILFFSEPLKWILFFTGLRKQHDIDKNISKIALVLIIIVSVLCMGNIIPLPGTSYLSAGIFIEPVFDALLLLLFVMMIKNSLPSSPNHKNQPTL